MRNSVFWECKKNIKSRQVIHCFTHYSTINWYKIVACIFLFQISSLRRRNQEFEAELKKCKGKLEILELKLEEKEDYINKLKMERYERPESRIVEKLKLLEQEVRTLNAHECMKNFMD